MNKNVLIAKKHFERQKRTYKIIGILMIITIILGALFYFIISDQDQTLVANTIKNFFSEIKKGDNLNYGASLINSLITNSFYVLLIWLLGISIIGLPIIILMIGYKCFIMGFSISSIISIYGFKGIIGAIAYTTPHQLLYLFTLMLLGFYAINFSIRLFNYLFLKKYINFKDIMKRYTKILLICIINSILLSLFETFISTYFIKLFTLLLK